MSAELTSINRSTKTINKLRSSKAIFLMEYISESQLQKYEDIINQTKTEFKKYEQLKKELELENNRIILSQLANSNLSQKMSHVDVKVFSDIVDLFSLYHGELQSDFRKHLKYKNCKFYLIEIYITKSLMEKIRDLQWLLSVTVKNDNLCVNKTIALTSKVPILEIFPIDENVTNCVIEASLIFPTNDKCMVKKLDSVQVDISYHFQAYKEKRKAESKTNNVLYITKCYNQAFNIQDIKKPLPLEYKFTCDVEDSHFIQSVLRNCYHRLEIELFSELGNDADNDFVLQFSSGIEKHKLIYNKKSKSLIINSNINDLCLLKKYFLKEFHIFKVLDKGSITNVKIKETDPKSCQAACAVYGEVRKCWSDLLI